MDETCCDCGGPIDRPVTFPAHAGIARRSEQPANIAAFRELTRSLQDAGLFALFAQLGSFLGSTAVLWDGPNDPERRPERK